MHSPRWRKVFRDLWLHKARTLLVMLAISTGIVGAGAVLDNWALLRRVTSQGYRATNPSSGTLRTERIDSALLAKVREVPAVAQVQGRRTVLGAARLSGGWITSSLSLADDFGRLAIHTITPVEGVWPPAEGGIVVEKSSAEFAGAAVGGSVTLQVGEGPTVTLPITGIARDPGLAPGWMEHVLYAFVSPGTLARLGADSALDQLQFTVRDRSLDRAGVRRVAVSIAAVVEGSGRTVRDLQIPEPGEHIHAAQMDSLLLTQGGFGVLALLLSGLLVVNLISAMLTGQVKEIGVMKAIGAGTGQIAAMYLVLALLLGVAASLVAIPTAALLGLQYARFSAELLNFSIEGFAIPRWAILVQLAAGVLLPLLAALAPVLRGCRIPVAAALRDSGISGARRSDTPGLLDRVGGLTRPLLLSLRNAFRRRQRMALTLLTLAMGGAVYLGALNLRASIRDSVGRLYGGIMRYDVLLRLEEALPPDSLESLVRTIPGAEAAEAWGVARAVPVGPDGMAGAAFPLTLLPAETAMFAFPVDSGRWLVPGDRQGMVVSRRLQQLEPELAVGTRATFMIAGRPVSWTIVGSVDAGPAGVAYAAREALSRVGQPAVDRLAIRGGAGEAGQAALTRSVRRELEESGHRVAGAQLLAESRRVLEDHTLMVAGFLLVMSQLTIVVGGLGLASTMSLAVLERTREIGVLRAIGAGPRGIFAIVQAEALVIALLSWALAIPLSLPVSWILGRRFGQVMLPVRAEFLPEPAALLWWLLVVLVVAVAATAWPARRATRIPTAAALTYE